MLGGGTFTTQNKILPGTYLNFVSRNNISNVFGERGAGAIACSLSWFDEEIHSITRTEFQRDSLILFGFGYDDEEVVFAREFFKNGKNLVYKAINTNGATKASNTYCSAKKFGQRGNDIKIVIQNNVDEEAKFDVLTYLGSILVDIQTVSNSEELKANEFVVFKAGANLATTAGLNLTGGKNGSISGESVQGFLSKIEGMNLNAVTTCGASEDLVVQWTKRMRDEIGLKYQSVVTSKANNPNYEGVIKVMDNLDEVLPWVCGAIAGCSVNKTLTNKIYDGELEIFNKLNHTQIELEKFINGGYFSLHKVGEDVRVLLDINSLVEVSEDKGEIFKDNQTIRVCDQIANDIANIFNTRYLGKVQNDEAGRSSFRKDIIRHHNKLMDIRAIDDFVNDDIVVEKGDTKGSVVVMDCITVVNAMNKLYMTVIVG